MSETFGFRTQTKSIQAIERFNSLKALDSLPGIIRGVLCCLLTNLSSSSSSSSTLSRGKLYIDRLIGGS